MGGTKLQIMKILERWGSFFRLILSLGAAIWLAFLTIYIGKAFLGNNLPISDFLLQNIFTIIKMIIAVIVLIVMYVLRFVLDNARLNIHHQIYDDETALSFHERLEKEQREGSYTTLAIKQGCSDPEKELEKLIGLASVKRNVEKMKALFEYEKKSGKNKKEKNYGRHYAFLGNPGTGKTTVARIFAGILYRYGLIQKNIYMECTGNDLTGEYSGMTKKKVDAIYKKVKGGVLFIDEAYVLQGQLAEEAIAQLLVKMEADPYTSVIFAGYTGPMLRFIEINPGLASRISQQIHFADYEPEDLVKIFKGFAKKKEIEISEEAEITLSWVFGQKKERVKELKENFSNGRYARNCFDAVYEQHALNQMERKNKENFNIIQKEDVLEIAHELLELQ